MRHVHDLNALHTESTLGENQHVTREGFLLCKNVPIARTGMQDYLNDEICEENDTDNELFGARGKNGIVQVERREDDVFRPETLASFEGKDVVDDHPDDPVHPGNYKQHTVGVTLNVRRGEGAFANFIVADLLIKDEAAIAAVRAGKREVSAGYDAEYEVLGPGKARQYDIIANHVALVDRGRCGFRCAIGDKEPDMTMKKKTPVNDAAARGLLRRMLDAIKSGDKKKLADAMEEMEGEEDEAPDAPALESTGTHIHLHLGGEEEAKGKDPSKAGAADEEEEPGEGEDPQGKKEAAGDPNGTRLTALEGAVNQLAESMRKLVARLGGDGGEEEEEAEGDSEGEEEAEGDTPDDPETDEAEAEEEPKDPKSKDKGKDKAGLLGGKGIDKKGKDKAKDKAIKDSAHLKDEFTDAKSGAEILAPGLKMPTFDSKAPAKLTTDGICLLKRRALAAATRDEKNGGKDAVSTMLGRKPLAGLDCGAVDTVFNGAVALMKDRNSQDDTTTVGRVRIGKAKDAAVAPKSIGELNNMNRSHYKQAKLPGA